MSRKGASSSKFGHLFGDSEGNFSASSSQSRLSTSDDLYRDPLAALLPPVTATTTTTTTTTTRGGAAAVRATLSPSAPVTSSTSFSARNSPPSSGSNSRSSSRLQHHALFSSLTGGDSSAGSTGGGSTSSSMFDSMTVPASSALSAAKRDLLFGEGSSTTSSSSAARRTSTPPLSRNTTAAGSTRVPTPPLRTTATTLDADASPLGLFLDSSNNDKKDDDTLSIKSPLSTVATSQPMTRTNSQASTKSHESVRSSKSIQAQEAVEDAKPATSRLGGARSASATGSGASSLRSTMKKVSMDQQQQQSAKQAVPVDPIFNPLSYGSSAAASPSGVSSPGGTSQSIETFQAISRTSSPANAQAISTITTSATTTSNISPPPLSKSGFERDYDTMSSPPISKSRLPLNVAIMDDAAEAFSKDLLFSIEPTSAASAHSIADTTSSSTLHSSSFLDSGYIHSRAVASSISSSSNAIGSSTTGSGNRGGITVAAPGVGAGAVGQAKSLSGFSLGEDVSENSNPWMNSLVDSMDQTTLAGSSLAGAGALTAVTKIDYTQSDAAVSFLPEAAFTLTKDTLTTSRSSDMSSTTRSTTTLTSMPSLEDDIGGFDEVFTTSSLRSRNTGLPAGGALTSSSASRTSASPSLQSTTLTTTTTMIRTWDIQDAVEAASQDPDFMGAASLLNQSNAKVLDMMQMPKEPLEKDVAAQEVFDNPWE
ncbi:hypothetical protein EDD11_001651 [Mortierella claussenii]|nr:hypothetical protein EDD11_001651 [Mortierella claussenii]